MIIGFSMKLAPTPLKKHPKNSVSAGGCKQRASSVDDLAVKLLNWTLCKALEMSLSWLKSGLLLLGAGLTGRILNSISAAGFQISALRMVNINPPPHPNSHPPLHSFLIPLRFGAVMFYQSVFSPLLCDLSADFLPGRAALTSAQTPASPFRRAALDPMSIGVGGRSIRPSCLSAQAYAEHDGPLMQMNSVLVRVGSGPAETIKALLGRRWRKNS